MKLFSMVLIAVGLFSSVGQAVPRESGGMMAPAAIQLEFFSPGNGIDFDLLRKVTALIEADHAAGKIKDLRHKNGGMEGDTTICLEHNEYWAFKAFVEKLEPLVARGQRKTNVSYKADCRGL